MSLEAFEAYEQAKRLAEREVAKRQAEDKYPYLESLNKVMNGKTGSGEMRLGQQEISIEKIAGTRQDARAEAFACNFMPLLPSDSEFAHKWCSLYDSQLEEGLRDPIKVYEYMFKYYVQEGNKRVSIMRFLGAKEIMAEVIRILPPKDDSDSSKLYYDYLEFAKNSGIHDLSFSQPSSYRKVSSLFGQKLHEEWPEKAREDLKNAAAHFFKAFDKLGGKDLPISQSDALYSYLKIYGFSDLLKKSTHDLENQIRKIWNDFAVFPNKPNSRLMMSNEDVKERRSIFNMHFQPLKVAFIDSRTPETSAWTKKHEDARKYLQNMLSSEVRTSVYFGADDPAKEEEILEKAVKDGNEVIFTTSPAMLRSSIKLAAKYPRLKVLNCSLNTKTGHLRTYFARVFEIQFLFGMIAGILTRTNAIGYIADYPIYGMIANINAFALGVKMVNPNARIYLDWSTTKQPTLKEWPKDVDITFIAGQEFDSSVMSTSEYGLYDATSGRYYNISNINYYWGEFYVKIMKSILSGQWRYDTESARGDSINYWWGLSNHMLDINFKEGLPKQTRRLIEVMKEHMQEGHFNLFSTEMHDQQGNLRNGENDSLTPEEIVEMDWLLNNITGTIPIADDFSEDARRMVVLHGIEKIKEKEPENHEDDQNPVHS